VHTQMYQPPYLVVLTYSLAQAFWLGYNYLPARQSETRYATSELQAPVIEQDESLIIIQYIHKYSIFLHYNYFALLVDIVSKLLWL